MNAFLLVRARRLRQIEEEQLMLQQEEAAARIKEAEVERAKERLALKVSFHQKLLRPCVPIDSS